jgi:hypothetical protein
VTLARDTNPADMDLSVDQGFTLGESICFMVVCVPKSWDNGRIESFAGASGTSSGWCIADPDPEVFNGETRIQCPDEEERVHVLLNC